MNPLVLDSVAKNKTAPIVLGVLIVGLGFLSYFGVVKPILCKLNISDCRSDRQRKRNIEKLLSMNAFDPNFYRADMITISHFRAKELADQLDDAISGSGTDEDSLFGALREAKNPNNLSLVSKYYGVRKGMSLVDRIINDLNDNELNQVLTTLK
jgi:hypothetical protein